MCNYEEIFIRDRDGRSADMIYSVETWDNEIVRDMEQLRHQKIFRMMMTEAIVQENYEKFIMNKVAYGWNCQIGGGNGRRETREIQAVVVDQNDNNGGG